MQAVSAHCAEGNAFCLRASVLDRGLVVIHSSLTTVHLLCGHHVLLCSTTCLWQRFRRRSLTKKPEVLSASEMVLLDLPLFPIHWLLGRSKPNSTALLDGLRFVGPKPCAALGGALA